MQLLDFIAPHNWNTVVCMAFSNQPILKQIFILSDMCRVQRKVQVLSQSAHTK